MSPNLNVELRLDHCLNDCCGYQPLRWWNLRKAGEYIVTIHWTRAKRDPTKPILADKRMLAAPSFIVDRITGVFLFKGTWRIEVTPVEVELVISTRNGLNEINFVSNEALKIKARARRWSRRRWFYIERSGWKGPNDRSSAACMFAHIIESDSTIVYAVRCVYDVHYVRRRTRTMQTFVVKKKSKFKWIKSPPNHYALLGAASPTSELLILSYLLSPLPSPQGVDSFLSFLLSCSVNNIYKWSSNTRANFCPFPYSS